MSLLRFTSRAASSWAFPFQIRSNEKVTTQNLQLFRVIPLCCFNRVTNTCFLPRNFPRCFVRKLWLDQKALDCPEPSPLGSPTIYYHVSTRSKTVQMNLAVTSCYAGRVTLTCCLACLWSCLRKKERRRRRSTAAEHPQGNSQVERFWPIYKRYFIMSADGRSPHILV